MKTVRHCIWLRKWGIRIYMTYFFKVKF